MASDWKNAFDTSGLLDSLAAMRARAGGIGGGFGGSSAPEPKQTPDDNALASKLTDIAGGEGEPASSVSLTSYAKERAKGLATPPLGNTVDATPPPALPEPPPKPPGGVAKRTSVNGVYAIKGPDGSTTFTDVPGGTFQQVGNGGGTPDTQRTPGGRTVGEVGTGSGNFSAAGATAGGGLRYVRPDGSGVADEGTRQGLAPGSPAWLHANANVAQGKDESDADFGARVAASKAAGLNYRTNSGEYALRAQPTDPAVIGPDAAYGRNGGGSGGGAPGYPYGQPNLEQAKAIVDIQGKQQDQVLAARNQGLKEQGIQDTKATDRYTTAKTDFLKENPNDVQGAEAWANIAAAQDLIREGKNPHSTDAGRRGMQYLADTLSNYTNPSGALDAATGAKARGYGQTTLADYAQGANSWYNPFKAKYTVSRRNNDGSTNSTWAGGLLPHQGVPPALARIIGKSGENAINLQPFIEADRAHQDDLMRQASGVGRR